MNKKKINIKIICLAVVLVAIFSVGITFFIHENRESDNVVSSNEELTITFTPQDENEEPEETGNEKKVGALDHKDYFYDASEEIPEDDDGSTPIRSHTYEAVEEK